MTEEVDPSAESTPVPMGPLRRYKIQVLKHPSSQNTETLEILGSGISFWSDGGSGVAMLVVGDETGNAIYAVPLSRVYSLVDPDHDIGTTGSYAILPRRDA